MHDKHTSPLVCTGAVVGPSRSRSSLNHVEDDGFAPLVVAVCECGAHLIRRHVSGRVPYTSGRANRKCSKYN